MTDTQSQEQVTQEDMEAAKAFWMRHVAGWQEVGAGQRALVKAFAKHRVESIARATLSGDTHHERG